MKKSADYSTTIIYKIVCKDPNVTDKYVGHTTDIVRRRQAHKNSTSNDKYIGYNLKLYKVIRENGGWDNWKMEIVACYDCNNLHEAKQKEQEHYNELKATLNSIEPMKLKELASNDVVEAPHENYYCKYCEFTSCNTSIWDNHLLSRKHENRINLIAKRSNKKEYVDSKFTCEKCDYKCCNKFDFNKHLLTRKHLEDNEKSQNVANEFKCKNCGNIYKYKSGLCKHAKTCKMTTQIQSQIPIQPQSQIQTQPQSSELATLTNLIMELVKNSTDIQKQLIELCKT